MKRSGSICKYDPMSEETVYFISIVCIFFVAADTEVLVTMPLACRSFKVS